MPFEFATATRIRFGPGVAREAAAAVADLGRRACLVTGRDPARAAWLAQDLAQAGLPVMAFPVAGEPTLDLVRRGAVLAREAGCDVIVALGGGSALDAGKAIAALAVQPEDVLAYVEVIGRGQPLAADPLPVVAIPTTAGTGSEVTRNAVLGASEAGVKVSLRSPRMLPRLALVDPLLTLDLPPAQTAAGGLDALTQLLEPFVSPGASPLTDALCREALPRAARALPQAVAHGHDVEAREAMALASLFGGLALANARLGAVHGLAAPLGGALGAPHGALCARLLPEVWAANVAALEARQPDAPALGRYREAAALLTGRSEASLSQGETWLRDLVKSLHIPGLDAWGLTEAAMPGLCAQARRASSMQGNPVALDEMELLAILQAAQKPL